MAEMQCAIRCSGITKTFGSVVANDAIDLEVNYGEVLALLGENGSGKTTLMNMLSGIYHPDAGQIFVNGQPVSIASPVDARALGIGMIHQHFKLVEVFTAMENIVLGMPGKMPSRKALRAEVKDLCDTYGLEIDPEKPVWEMSVSEKQTVEILKVLYRGAKILILDEPTAVLTPQETDKLFDILRQMKAKGCAVIIITHKLNEVLAISDRVTILRKGKSVDTVATAEVDANRLTELMVGHAVSLAIRRPEPKDVHTILKGEPGHPPPRAQGRAHHPQGGGPDGGKAGRQPRPRRRELPHPQRRDFGRGGRCRQRPEGAVRVHRRPCARQKGRGAL